MQLTQERTHTQSMKMLNRMIKLALFSSVMTQPLFANQEEQKQLNTQLKDDITSVEVKTYNLPSNSDWNLKDIPDDFYQSPYQINLFSDNHGQDRERLWSQTQSVMAYGFGVAGLILMLPEDISKWDKENGVFSKWTDNVKEGPTWDRDVWWLNWIGHPYFGGVYYQVARKSGYRQWDSFLYAFTMSTFYWEYGIEGFAEIPSMQDLVITPVLGWAYGEWAYQTEMEIRSTGGEVWGSKTLGDVSLFLLDPIDAAGKGINNLFDMEVVKAGTGGINFAKMQLPTGEYEDQVQLNVHYQLGSGKAQQAPTYQKNYISKKDPVDIGVIGLGLNYGSLNPGEHWGLEQDVANGWNLGLYFSPRFSMKLDYLKGQLPREIGSGDQTFEQFNVGANYYFNSDSSFRPFVSAGAGEMLYAKNNEDGGDSTFALNAGLGMHYQINNNFALQLDAKRFFNSKYSNNDTAYNFSLIYFFGEGQR